MSREPSSDIDPEDVEQLYADIPRVLRELKEGREATRRRSRQAQVIAAFVASCMLIMGLVLDGAQDNIRDDQRHDRLHDKAVCDDLTDNAKRFNRLIDTIILRTQQNPATTEAEKKYATRLFESTRQTIPVCTAS